MGKLKTILTGLGLGAGLMYLWDPEQGNRRRAMLRDQVQKTVNSTDEAFNVAVTDLRNRTRGVLAEAMAWVSEEETPDWIIEERVRAELGLFSRNPGSVEVSSNGRIVTLRGPVLASEVDQIIRRVSRVRGVIKVHNEMEVHQEPGSIPGLQTDGQANGGYPAQQLWMPGTRLVAGVGGGMMTLYGLVRDDLLGTLFSTAGLGLVARSVINRDLMSILGLGSTRYAITVQKTINIDAPVEEVYRFWDRPENLPKFMANVHQVKKLGERRYHWTVRGPAGAEVEWIAQVTDQQPNERLAWETLPEEAVKNAGIVQFRERPEGGTRLTVRMGYTPPAGAVGHAVASLFGQNPKQQMDEDLNRLKTLLEEGKTTVDGREVTAQQAAGAG